ncbi:MAG: hypothetical protein RIR39_865 [Pseudomonadota bacterium]
MPLSMPVPPKKNRGLRAAKAMADYDSRFNKIDQDMALLKAEIVVLKWMLGFLVAGMVTLLFKAFTA